MAFKKKALPKNTLTRAELLRLPKVRLFEIAEAEGFTFSDDPKKRPSRRALVALIVPTKWKVEHTQPNRAERRARARSGYNVSSVLNTPHEVNL